MAYHINKNVPCNLRQSYLRELPLLHFVSNLYPNVNLEEIYIICAQHIVSTTYSLFYTLLNLGLDPQNLSVIGKCYSTDPTAYKEMQNLGIDLCESSFSFNSHCAFDLQYKEDIKKFVLRRLQKIKNKKIKKVIILDDGGELILAVNQLSNGENFIGIEQTSSGYHKLKMQNLHFPIINVARSFAKLNYESPIIARLIIDTLLKNLNDLPIIPQKILIIGNGFIGNNLFEKLKVRFSVSIFDKKIKKSNLKKTKLKEAFETSDLIIGCTGQSILYHTDYKLLKKNAILVSASSSDREFNAAFLRSQIPLVQDCHANLFVNGFYLINCGFPINFSSNYEDIDIDDLQLTRSLLLLAILQANKSYNLKTKKIIPLNLKNQKEIVQTFFKIFNQDVHT